MIENFNRMGEAVMNGIDRINTHVQVLCNHPVCRLSFALGVLFFLYYQFLYSLGKISGVYDEDASGKKEI